MALALNNAQGELNELEVGLHALGAVEAGIAKSVNAYAQAIGTPQRTVANRVEAARVAGVSAYALTDLSKHWRALAELHPAPRWLWRSLVSRLVSEGWTVEIAPPAWLAWPLAPGRHLGRSMEAQDGWRASWRPPGRFAVLHVLEWRWLTARRHRRLGTAPELLA
jgi:hypothetical protein